MIPGSLFKKNIKKTLCLITKVRVKNVRRTSVIKTLIITRIVHKKALKRWKINIT